tara:strand:+ start:554 stop:1561 length:1008 start_codon:yes stop_codon:yes gene_type:complete
MPVYTLQYVYQLSDFDTSGTLIAPPDESGAKAGATPPFDMALKIGAEAIQATVVDDDAVFHEKTDPNQILDAALTLDSVTYPVGTRIFINYVVSTDDGLQGYGFTLGENNNGSNKITGFVTTEPMIAGQTYEFTSNQNVGNNPVPYGEFACFTAGTMIKTAKGERRVEDLIPGDRVMTRDHGLQSIRWAGKRTVAGIGEMTPISFDAGTLGCTAPLTVSPNHRMLISGAMAELVCGDDELLLSAKMLVNGRNVRRVPCGFVTYVHIMFDYHEIIWANDCPTESFYVGDHAIDALDTVQAAEVLAIFPELRWHDKRPSLARAEGRSYEGTVIAATL